jgi:hypothetical protein
VCEGETPLALAKQCTHISNGSNGGKTSAAASTSRRNQAKEICGGDRKKATCSLELMNLERFVAKEPIALDLAMPK